MPRLLKEPVELPEEFASIIDNNKTSFRRGIISINGEGQKTFELNSRDHKLYRTFSTTLSKMERLNETRKQLEDVTIIRVRCYIVGENQWMIIEPTSNDNNCILM